MNDLQSSKERVLLEVVGAQSQWDFDQTWHSGIYEAQFNLPQIPAQTFAVNVDTQESDLTRFDVEMLPSQFSRDLKMDDNLVPQLAGGAVSSLFPYFLAAVLVLLIAETFFAWRFGTAAA